MINPPEKDMAARTRRSFLVLGAGAVAGIAGWTWLMNQPDEDGIPSPLRRIFSANQKITSSALYGNNHLAPEFPKSTIEEIRANGDLGLDDDIEEGDWRLNLTTPSSKQPLTMAQIRTLPRVEHTMEFKCVEGWSNVVQWAGVRFSDFKDRFASNSAHTQYVGFKTPNEEYYVGMDLPSALHPQTMLAYEQNGKPLTAEHGAPLRLVTPVKYGIKNLKRIGSISFTDQRPPDYWAEHGYDYYAAL